MKKCLVKRFLANTTDDQSPPQHFTKHAPHTQALYSSSKATGSQWLLISDQGLLRVTFTSVAVWNVFVFSFVSSPFHSYSSFSSSLPSSSSYFYPFSSSCPHMLLPSPPHSSTSPSLLLMFLLLLLLLIVFYSSPYPYNSPFSPIFLLILLLLLLHLLLPSLYSLSLCFYSFHSSLYPFSSLCVSPSTPPYIPSPPSPPATPHSPATCSQLAMHFSQSAVFPNLSLQFVVLQLITCLYTVLQLLTSVCTQFCSH